MIVYAYVRNLSTSISALNDHWSNRTERRFLNKILHDSDDMPIPAIDNCFTDRVVKIKYLGGGFINNHRSRISWKFSQIKIPPCN
ncbi:hypothetical protein D3C81_1297140 [compost metagenome]